MKNKKIFLIIFMLVLSVLIFSGCELEESFNNVNNEVSSVTTNGIEDKSVSNSSSSATSDATREQKNALKKAESYSNMMHMSKKAIYAQLTSEYGEKFSATDAQYAIDNIKADWNANALAKAKSYQDSMNMSKSAIYDQLTSEYGEQFTKAEAQYAIDHLGE